MTKFETMYLAHHGIRGQKWGVRNGPPYPLENDTGSEVSRRRNEYKNRRNLSDAELEKKIKRYRLEKEYRDLAKEDFASGEVYVNNILKEIGRRALPAIGTGLVLYGAKAIAQRKFDPMQFGEAIFNGGPKKK